MRKRDGEGTKEGEGGKIERERERDMEKCVRIRTRVERRGGDCCRDMKL